MKRISAFLLISLLLLSLSACSGKGSGSASRDISSRVEDSVSEKKAESAGKENIGKDGDSGDPNAVDIDLTKLSSTMLYSELCNILYEADQYVGRIIRMQGQFASYFDEKESKYYTAVIISDAMACCQQGLEFVWLGHDPLDGFPKEGTLLTVTGEFEIYEEDGQKYCRISASEVTEP